MLYVSKMLRRAKILGMKKNRLNKQFDRSFGIPNSYLLQMLEYVVQKLAVGQELTASQYGCVFRLVWNIDVYI